LSLPSVSGEGNPPEVPGGMTESYSTTDPRPHVFVFSGLPLFTFGNTTDYIPMEDFDLRTFGRKLLLLVAILSALVIGEMILVSAEEPPVSAQQQAVYKASR